MPVIGPSDPDPEHVKKIYNEVIELLKNKFHIQNHEPEKFPNWQEDRDKRNAVLYGAIYSLVELHYWETW